MVDIGSDLLPRDIGRLKSVHIDLSIRMTHVADDAAVLHCLHVLAGDDALIPSGSHHLHVVQQML